jgi:hypothetical protein
LLFFTYTTRKTAGAGGTVGEAGIGSKVGGISVAPWGDKAVKVAATWVPMSSTGFDVGVPPGMAHARLTIISRETIVKIRIDLFILLLHTSSILFD